MTWLGKHYGARSFFICCPPDQGSKENKRSLVRRQIHSVDAHPVHSQARDECKVHNDLVDWASVIHWTCDKAWVLVCLLHTHTVHLSDRAGIRIAKGLRGSVHPIHKSRAKSRTLLGPRVATAPGKSVPVRRKQGYPPTLSTEIVG